MKALIFGANGQDGFYLTESFRADGIEPVGVDRAGAMIHADVADFASVERLLREHEPSYIVHLAALSSTRHDALFANHAAISTGTINILEAVHRSRLPARVLLCGSGVQFRNDGTPINEQTAFEASSAYAVARIHSVFAARYYRTLGVRAYVAYLFHHESPRRPDDHVSQRIVRTIQRIARGSHEFLEIGDPRVAKEWSFAGDIVNGMRVLLGQEQHWEAVIGSGELHTIQEWIDTCCAIAGVDPSAYVRTTPGFRAEYATLRSDPSLLRSLGWRPAVEFTQLATMMMNA